MAEERTIARLSLDVGDIPEQVRALAGNLDNATSVIRRFARGSSQETSITIKSFNA